MGTMPTKKVAQAEMKKLIDHEQVFQIRRRFTIAQVEAGAEVLPALSRGKYRLVDAAMIAIGGAAATATDVRLLATQTAAAVALMIATVAGLTQDTLLRIGTAVTGLPLAGGLSFVENDINTAITIGKTGAALAIATHIDVLVTYVISGDVDL